MRDRVWTIVTMVRNKEEAVAMAEAAVNEGKAACAQLEGPVTSVYSWQEKITREEEMRITFKASSGNVRDLMDWIRHRHSYEVPEILAWPAGISDPDYRDWVSKT
jgi:periplasmic divalent cation tolerance protein